METKSNRHAFFKFFFPDSSAIQLEIPSVFVLSIEGALPDKVVLRDRYNNLWQVKVAKVGDKLCLQDGWPKFVEDNSVKAGDLLVFEYFSNGLFDIKIYGASACEKKGVGGFKDTEEQTKSVKIEDEDEEGKEEDEASDDIYTLESERDDEEEEENPTNHYALKRKRGTSSGKREKLSRSGRVADIYGAEIFRSGLAPEPKNPFFITKINPGHKGELEIPSAFALSIQEALPDKVVLRHGYNNLWQVKVAKVGDKLCLQDGWPKFVEDNSIKGGDLLVFEYFSNGLFDTKIYGSSACEKKEVGAFKVTEEKTKSVKEEDEASDDIHMLESERDDEEEEEIPSNDYALKRERGTTSGTREKPDRIRRVADIYGTEIFLSGLAPEPKNPFFITKINPRRKGELYIPKDIINAQNLNLPEEILMVDPNGRKWSAKRKIWRDGRTYYTQGWRRLCQSNFVEENDVCICEFIQRGRRLCMNVSFVRANQV